MLVGAFAARIAWAMYAAGPPIGLHDPSLYRIFGERLADGQGYTVLDGSPTAYFPIGYPLVLAVAFAVTPAQWHTGVVVMINTAAQVVSVWLVYRIALAAGRGRERPALIAAALVAWWPNLVINSAIPLSESVFVALVLGAVLVVVRDADQVRSPSPRQLTWVGVLLGASVLVRPVSPLLLVVFGVAWAMSRTNWRSTIARVGLVGVVATAVISPWVVRNALVMDSAVFATNTGDNVCMSRRVGGSGGFEYPNPRCNSGPFDALPRPAFEVERDAHGRRLAFEFVRDHPLEELRQWPRRLSYAVRWDDDGVAAVESYGEDPFLGGTARRTLKLLSNTFYYAVVGPSIIGLVLLARTRRPAAMVVALAPAALLVPVMLTFGDPRFKIPALPFLAIGAGVALDCLWVRVRARSVLHRDWADGRGSQPPGGLS